MSDSLNQPDPRTPAVKSVRWLVVLPFLFGCLVVGVVWQLGIRPEKPAVVAASTNVGPRWDLDVPSIPAVPAEPVAVATSAPPAKAVASPVAPPLSEVLPPLPEPMPPAAAELPAPPPLPQVAVPANQFVSAGTQIPIAGWGIIGRALLKGTPAPEKPIPMDPNCGKLHKTPVNTRLYVSGTGGGLGDVFVQIKGLSGTAPQAPLQPVLLDQVGCEYTPYVMAIQTGQSLFVRNSDPVMHNVHPIPTVPANGEVNKAQLPRSADLEFRFDTPEMFLRFKCDVHPWMFAYVSVVDHPYFAVTDVDGNYRLPQLPPGFYVIEATHRKAGTTTRTIKILPGKTAVENFVFEAK